MIADIYKPCPQVARQLFGNFRLSSNFQLVEQLSMDQATFTYLSLDSNSHAPATSETIKKCSILLVLRIYLSNLLVLLLGITCFYRKMFLRNKRL